MHATSSSPTRFLPHAVVATLAVVVLPAVAVSFVGTLGSPWLAVASVLLAMAISIAAASAGSAIWARRPGSRDMVFADLMLWGWLRRVRAERRLAEARGLLGAAPGGSEAIEMSRERRCEVLQQLAAELEAKDSYTLGHSRRVTRHSERIARELGLPDDEVARIRTAASVHDVGKVRTPRQMLTKPGPLSDEEFAVVRRHAADGADMVSGLGDAAVAAMVRHHHERLDGSGYPDGLRGGDIPLGARIIAVADTFDAMTSTRPYQRSYKHRQALEVLSEDAGRRLDADAVSAFLRYYSGTRGVAWSAVGFAAQPRLAAWAGGALSGVGGWTAPVPQSLAAILAAALAGLGMSGPATPETMARDAAAKRAGLATAEAGDRRDVLARGPVGGTPGGVVRIGGGVNWSGRAAPPDRRGDRPAGGGPVETPSLPVPGVKPPAIRPPAVRPPAIQPPAVELPGTETPAVEIPSIDVPRIETPAVEVPSIQAPAVELPGLGTPSVGTPRIELPRVQLPAVEITP
jgi:putative nucleotidyltransferase with HDIG domain